jgi:uncharacterized protein DUF6307
MPGAERITSAPEGLMSMTYTQRRTVVANALAAEGARPADGTTLPDLAAKVLDALDHIRENIR